MSNPINAAEFSATAYFFAKNLYDELKVPIGIINSSWGGTPVESWADQSALQNVPAYKETFKNTDATEDKKKKYEEWLQPLDSFPETTEKTTYEEWSKLAFDDLSFSTEEFDDTQWLDLSIPGNYADVFSGYTASDFDGIVWIRKSFTIDQLGKDSNLNLVWLMIWTLLLSMVSSLAQLLEKTASKKSNMKFLRIAQRGGEHHRYSTNRHHG